MTNSADHGTKKTGLRLLYITFSDLGYDSGSSVNDKMLFSGFTKTFSCADLIFVNWKKQRSYPVAYVIFFFRLFLKSIKQKYDLLICRGFLTFLLSYILKPILRTKMIMLHTEDTLFHSEEIKAEILPKHTISRKADYSLFYLLERFAFAKANGYITASPIAKRILEKSYKNVFYIPWAVPNPFFNIHKSHNNSSYLRLLYVGGFMPHDKVLNILSALKNLVHEGLLINLTMVGTGPLLSEVKNQIDLLSLSNHVNIIGPQPRSKLPEILKNYDIFICPISTKIVISTIPIKILEATAEAMAVITTRCGAIPTIFKDTLFYVDEPLTESLINQVKKLYNDRELMHKKGISSQKIAMHFFKEDVLVHSISDMVEILINEASVL